MQIRQVGNEVVANQEAKKHPVINDVLHIEPINLFLKKKFQRVCLGSYLSTHTDDIEGMLPREWRKCTVSAEFMLNPMTGVIIHCKALWSWLEKRYIKTS